MIKEIPAGWKKMDLVLTFTYDEVKVFEDTVFRFLVRDYNIMYSKLPKFDGKEWTELHFYCRPKDEVSIAYRMGGYASQALKFYNKSYFAKHGGHVVAQPFPESYQVSITQKNQLFFVGSLTFKQ